MISATAEPQLDPASPYRGARRLKVWVAIALVFAAQVGVVFWVGNPPAKPSPASAGPVIHVIGSGSQEMLALQDPTLFVLPHRENFSGDAWLNIRPREFSPTNWTEPAQPLQILPQQLGAAFVAFMKSNRPPRFQPRIESGLDTEEVAVPPLAPLSSPSRLRVEGDLAHLRLLTPLSLPPQTNSDLLTNTVIQLVVDGHGNPFSAVIAGRSGSDEADSEALTNFARAVRFAPPEAAALGRVPLDRMISGKLIFEWQTMPSNAPPANP